MNGRCMACWDAAAARAGRCTIEGRGGCGSAGSGLQCDMLSAQEDDRYKAPPAMILVCSLGRPCAAPAKCGRTLLDLYPSCLVVSVTIQTPFYIMPPQFRACASILLLPILLSPLRLRSFCKAGSLTFLSFPHSSVRLQRKPACYDAARPFFHHPARERTRPSFSHRKWRRGSTRKTQSLCHPSADPPPPEPR